MKILHLVLMVFFVSYAFAADTDDYQISGVVNERGGGPLEGVNVLLKGKNVSMVTGADGAFEFTSVAVRMNVPQKQTLSFTLRGNSVAFSPGAGKLDGNVAVFSGNGRRIASTSFSGLNPATEQITLPQLVSGINIIRATVNNTIHTCQLMRLGNKLHLINNHVSSRSGNSFTLAKMAAESEAVDTLVATKEGFQEAMLPVESYMLSDVSIEMDSTFKGGEIMWGKKENPTANLTNLNDFPGYNDLTPNSKMPDPFLMLDGTRITNKSEWAVRREELYQQCLHYIYGDKPIPPEGSVSGTVSSNNISVEVNEGGKRCSFSASVKMNGASQPAPALISYGSMGGVSAPSGVAQITFNAIEETGGSGPKKGPFYDFYGSDHPAGYLTAQAWQVSRIIDVLEQNPGIIDPFKIAVTGCSRWGKGAFVAGVLDNRIALTIPVESGIGGTVALRLVKQLDTGGEWPYHAISYVRWLSEVALGRFTSGNNAGSDNTDRLPVDMHSAMALIAPRGLYIVDNPSGTYAGLDARSAWVTASIGKKIFEALGVGDHFAYEGASGSHCQWRNQYTASLNAMVDKFLKGNNSANTGSVNTDLGNKPNAQQYYDWDTSELSGEL